MIRTLTKSTILTLLFFSFPNHAMEVPNNNHYKEFYQLPTMTLPPDSLNIILNHLDTTDHLIDRIQFLSTCLGFYEYGWSAVHKKHPKMYSLTWHQLRFPTIRECRHFNYLITLAVDHFGKFSDLLGRSYSNESLENHRSILNQSCKLFDTLSHKAQSAQDYYFNQTMGRFAYMTGFRFFEEREQQPLIPLLHFLRNHAEGNILYRGEYVGEAINNMLQDPRRASRVMLKSSPMFQITNTKYENSLKQYCHRISELHSRCHDIAYPEEYGLHAALFSGWIGQEDCKEKNGCRDEYIVVKRPRTGFLYSSGLGGNFASYFAYEFPDALSEDFHRFCHLHFRGMLTSKANIMQGATNDI